MSKRGAIIHKPGTDEINRRTAEKLGIPIDQVRSITRAYWIDIEQMFLTCSGYATYVEQFGHFIIYTKGIAGHAAQIERDIRKKLKFMQYLEREGVTERRKLVAGDIAKCMSQIILLSYSIQLYKTEVLSEYPKKYKVANEKAFKAVISRLEELFGVPLVEFPITVSYPIQKIFVQKLRKAGILQNPVLDLVKG